MITFYTIPRPFEGVFNTIQRNAIESWQAIAPEAQIILMGANGKDIAIEYGLEWSDIKNSDNGVPLVNNAIAKAENLARYPVKVFCNTDNIFMNDLLLAINQVKAQLETFVIVGRRWDIDLEKRITFTTGWQVWLTNYIQLAAYHQGYSAVDYFAYTGDPWRDMPPFAVGHDRYDHWMVREAVMQGWPVIDASEKITMVHQNHPIKAGANLDDFATNEEMAELEHKWSIKYATWVLSASRGLVKKKVKGKSRDKTVKEQ